jgi:hypothetical protein
MNYEFNDYSLQVRSDEQEAPTGKPVSSNPEARVGLSIVGNLNANYNRGPVKKLRIEQFLNTEIKALKLRLPRCTTSNQLHQRPGNREC